jgi:uncharacterized protein
VRVEPGVTLGGTLTLPDVAGARAPAVVLISDASPEDRDGVTAADTSRFYWALADTLSRRGIAVLRMDDRGVASSSGSLDSVDTFARSFDTRAGLDLLRRTPGVDPARLGLVGVGEGATIAMIIAASDHTLAGIVLVGAPVRPGQERVEEHVRDEAGRAGGAQRDSVERALRERPVAGVLGRARSDRHGEARARGVARDRRPCRPGRGRPRERVARVGGRRESRDAACLRRSRGSLDAEVEPGSHA